MNRVFTPAILIPLFKAIDFENLGLVLVGGQAINIWASYYVNRVPELNNYLPFSSADLDFYGGGIEAIACQRILGGQIKLNQDFEPTPNKGATFWTTSFKLFQNVSMPIESHSTYKGQLQFLSRSETIQQVTTVPCWDNCRLRLYLIWSKLFRKCFYA
jgi:hypothetical protein